MKKILIILSAMVLAAASCTKFAEDSPRIFAASGDVKAPVITLGLAPGANADSSFTVRVTPAEGTSYYAWAIFEGAAANLPAANLLANAYKADAMSSGSVKLEAGKENFFVALEDLEPNTTYTVYAVACDADGITSEVAVKSHLTTDSSEGPILIDADSEIDDDGVMWLYAKFSKPVELGEGAVTLQQYALNSAPDATTGLLVPERTMVAPEDNVMVDGAWLCVAVPEALAVPGALITMTWEAGTVVNSAGLKDAGYAVSEVSADGLEDGIGERYDTKTFNLKYPMVLNPQKTALVRMPADTVIYFSDPTFPNFYITCVSDSVVVKADPAVRVVFENAKGRRVEYDATTIGAINDTTFFLGLDEVIDFGYDITVTVAKDCMTDIWGNKNAEFTMKKNYFRSYGYTLDDIVGTYAYTGIATKDGPQADEVVIAPDGTGGLDVYGIFSSNTSMATVVPSWPYTPVVSTKTKASLDVNSGEVRFEAVTLGTIALGDGLTLIACGDHKDDEFYGMMSDSGQVNVAETIYLYIPGAGTVDTVNSVELVRTSTDYVVPDVPATASVMQLYTGVDVRKWVDIH